MKVSIITVCKNSEKTIEKSIQHVISQIYPTIEYIIIDGQSTDSTLDIIKKYSSSITRLVSEPDGGIYQAMNKGIQLATGSFIYFANADDCLFDSTVIHDLVQFVTEHPNCDLVYGDHEARFQSGEARIYQAVPPSAMLEELICLGDHPLHQPDSFFKADLFQTLGLFSEHYRIASDYEWFLRLLSHPDLNLYYIPRTIVSYAHGGASANLRALFEEVFAIQNQDELCQQPVWIDKRIRKLQTLYVDKYEQLERTNALAIARHRRITHLENTLTSTALPADVDALQARIAAMESSKFWKLRSLWFKIKQALRLPD